jgi:hypothetical protein
VEGKNKYGTSNKRGNQNHPKIFKKITGEHNMKELWRITNYL